MDSFISPRAEKRSSGIAGRGLFAREPFEPGEIVAVKGGSILDRETFLELREEISPAEIQIGDDLFIGPRSAEDVERNLLCLNHSCAPNTGVRGEITFVTMRHVPAGEELTIDYAMIDGEPGETMECRCGAQDCRRIVTGDDWRSPDLQKRYEGYFSRYLIERMRRQTTP